MNNLLLLSEQLLQKLQDFKNIHHLESFSTVCFNKFLKPDQKGFDLDDIILLNLDFNADLNVLTNQKRLLFQREDFGYLSLILLDDLIQNRTTDLEIFWNENCAKMLSNILAFRYSALVDWNDILNFPTLLLKKCLKKIIQQKNK